VWNLNLTRIKKPAFAATTADVRFGSEADIETSLTVTLFAGARTELPVISVRGRCKIKLMRKR